MQLASFQMFEFDIKMTSKKHLEVFDLIKILLGEVH